MLLDVTVQREGQAPGVLPDAFEAIVSTPPPPSGTHAYFNWLTSLPQLMRAAHLRSQADINKFSQASPNVDVVYDPVMDAAKATIPAFRPHRELGANVDAVSDVLTFSGSVNLALLIKGRQLLIDDEIVTLYVPSGASSVSPGPKQVFVQRGRFGTVAVPHTAGTPVSLSSNSLDNQVRVPLGTSNGHTYVFTWDVRYDSSYLGYTRTGWKAYQFADEQIGRIWLEIRTNHQGQDALGFHPDYDKSTHVAVVNVRSYNTGLPTASGSNVTKFDPLTPQSGRFLIWPERWTRFFMKIQQRAGDFDLMDLWVADEVTPPVQIFSERTLTVRGSPPTILEWWLELNTSQDTYRGSLLPLVSWVRNFVALRDVADVSSLLIGPGELS